MYKLMYKAPQGRNFRGVVSSQRWPKPSLVLITPTQERWPGRVGLNGLDKYRDGRPAKGRSPIPVLTGLDVA